MRIQVWTTEKSNPGDHAHMVAEVDMEDVSLTRSKARLIAIEWLLKSYVTGVQLKEVE